MLHNLIPHRYNLYKWNLCNNPLCLFDDELHDSIHLFVNWKHTWLFWSRFIDIVESIFKIDFTFNNSVLINGYDLENKMFKSLIFSSSLRSTCIQFTSVTLTDHTLNLKKKSNQFDLLGVRHDSVEWLPLRYILEIFYLGHLLSDVNFSENRGKMPLH